MKEIFGSTFSHMGGYGWESHLYAVDEDGKLYAWGGNRSNALGIDNLGETVQHPKRVYGELENAHIVKVFVGSDDNAFAIDNNGEVYAWGSNSTWDYVQQKQIYGLLGLDNTTDDSVATPKKMLHLPVGERVEHINPGRKYLIFSNGKLYSWGGSHTYPVLDHSIPEGEEIWEYIDVPSYGQNLEAIIMRN